MLLYLNGLDALSDEQELKIKVIHLVLKKRSAQVGTIILKKWQFPEDMQRLPLQANSSEPVKGEILSLAHIIQVSKLLKSTDWERPLEQLPFDLLTYPAFHLLWANETQAMAQLNQLADDILQTKQLLSFS